MVRRSSYTALSLLRVGASLSLLGISTAVSQAQIAPRVVSPANGATVYSGQTLTVRVESPAASFAQVFAVGWKPLGAAAPLAGPPYEFTFQIPPDVPSDTYPLSAFGVTTNGVTSQSEPVLIHIERPDSPAELKLNLDSLTFDSPTDLGVGVVISGLFTDGVEVDLTHSTKTSYVSDNPAVVTVADGRVTPAGLGYASIIITHGDKTRYIDVEVLPAMTLAPDWTVLYASETQQFYAQGAAVGDFTLNWSISPDNLGSIDASGLYRAPASVSGQQIVIVTATSAADGTLTASAKLWLYPPLTLKVTPEVASLGPSQSQYFWAKVENPSNALVQWSLIPGVGHIDDSGSYTAPDVIPAPQTVMLTATSLTNPPRMSSATINLKPVPEEISTPAPPAGPASGATGILYQFTASGAVSSIGHEVQYSFNWGDGTFSGWTPHGVTTSFHTWNSPGTYIVRVMASCINDTGVVSTISGGLTVTIGGESISNPTTPTGTQEILTNTSYTYSTGGAASNAGHRVQYKLFWGDGSYSQWLAVGVTSASHTWMGPGTYVVTAQARCETDKEVLSPVSSRFIVSLTADETISEPAAPTGAVAGKAGTSYTYTAGGATSSKNKPIVYLFDWGDGTTSGWLSAGRTTASHTWAGPGIYRVTVLAADAANLLIQSTPSTGLTVEIQAP